MAVVLSLPVVGEVRDPLSTSSSTHPLCLLKGGTVSQAALLWIKDTTKGPLYGCPLCVNVSQSTTGLNLYCPPVSEPCKDTPAFHLRDFLNMLSYRPGSYCNQSYCS